MLSTTTTMFNTKKAFQFEMFWTFYYSEARHTTTQTPHETPIKNPAVLLQSTPIAGPSHLPELKISDISASEK